MLIEEVVTIGNQAIWMIIKCSAPMLLISLIVGLLISIFQTVTSIQEQTLTFVPKFLAIFIALMITGAWIFISIRDFTIELYSMFSKFA